MKTRRFIFSLVLFLLGAIALSINPSITGNVVSFIPQGVSNVLLILGFLFVFTGILLAISTSYDTDYSPGYDDPRDKEQFFDSEYSDYEGFDYSENKEKIKPEKRIIKND